MKKFMNKKFMVITAVALFLFAVVGGTLAYIITQTGSLENKFIPSKVSCAVMENNSGSENYGNIIDIGETKSDVRIKNTGDTDAFIRVAVVVNWVSADGSKVWATVPVRGTDYTIEEPSGSEWTKGTDGYYYYISAVTPGKQTSVLFKEVKLVKDVTGPKGADGTQYYLSVEIVASAIQAEGMGADSAQEAWALAATAPNAD